MIVTIEYVPTLSLEQQQQHRMRNAAYVGRLPRWKPAQEQHSLAQLRANSTQCKIGEIYRVSRYLKFVYTQPLIY